MHNQGFWPRLEPFFYKRQNVLLKTCWCFVLYTSKINEELCFWKKIPNNYQHFQNIFLYLQCQNTDDVNHSVEHPDRCSIRNWAIFMSIGQPYRGNPRIGTLYEICRYLLYAINAFGCLSQPFFAHGQNCGIVWRHGKWQPFLHPIGCKRTCLI